MSTKIKKNNKFNNDKFINNYNLREKINSSHISSSNRKSIFNILGGGDANKEGGESNKKTVNDSSFSLSGDNNEDTDSFKNQKKINYPWKITELKQFEDLWMKEPCFTEKDTIEENPKKKTYTNNSFTHTFFRGYYSISEIPIFGWKDEGSGKQKKFVLPKTLAKFLYCFFVKICGFPLYVAYLAVRIIVMIGKPFITKIPVILVATINTLGLLVMVAIKVLSLFTAPVPITHEFIKWDYYIVNEDGSKTKSEEDYYPGGISLIKLLFGFSIPYNVISPTEGHNYGRGEMGVFIFVVMAISAAIITVTGANVVVIMCVFIYFMFKTLVSIREKALGQDLRQGASKS